MTFFSLNPVIWQNTFFHLQMDSEPCGNFSHTLPYRASDMLWIYTKVTYFQPADYYGYDYLRMYIIDDKNGTSEVVTVQFTIMESPCQNKGVCKGMMFLDSF